MKPLIPGIMALAFALVGLGGVAWAQDDASAVVARVQGPHGAFTITLERLQAYRAAHPDKPARQALLDLVDFELLAAEAEAAGLGEAPEAIDAGRQVMARRFLDEVFEARWTAESLPRDMVRRSYDSNRGFFDHPELRVGDHLLVTTPKSKRPEGQLDAEARRLAERIHAELLAEPPPDRENFRARAARYQAEAEALGLAVLGQNLHRFARRGKYDPDFTAAAFAVEAPGLFTAAFPTQFGWHIARIDEIVPEKRQSFEQAEAELRVRIIDEARRLKFIELTEGLASAIAPLTEAPGVRGLVNTLPLDAVAVRRGVLVPNTPPSGAPGSPAPSTPAPTRP